MLAYITEVNARLDRNDVPPSQFVITKGMTKMPHEYPDAAQQAHVQVAKRMIAAGTILKGGAEIPYVMCDLPAASLAERARHPDEVVADPSLRIDVAWYKTSQVLPVVMRLCSPVDAIVPAALAECLGVDGAKFQARAAPGTTAPMEVEHVALENPQLLWDRLKASLAWPQTVCKCSHSLGPAVFATSRCPQCSAQLDPQFMHNACRLTLHGLTDKFFEGWLMCDEDTCLRRTRQVGLGGDGTRCTFGGIGRRCTGHMRPVFSEHALLEHLRVLAKLTQGQIELEHGKPDPALASMVEEVITYCGANFLSCDRLFSAMY